MATETQVATLEDANTDSATQAGTQAVTWSTDLAQYEDGQRVAITNDTFEWWYFDTIMDDGSTCVVTFLNKPPFMSYQLQPILLLNISTPAGRVYQKEIALDPKSYSSSPYRCDVKMGSSWVKGDLHRFDMSVEVEDLRAFLQFNTMVPGWRMGPYLPPEEAAKEWLGEQIVIPSGTVQGTLFYEGGQHPVKGTCYHDHQWGNATVKGDVKVTKWYWGRACFKDQPIVHSIVFAQVIGSVGGGPAKPVFSFFTLARDTGITYDDKLENITVTPYPEPGGIVVSWQSSQGNVKLDMPSRKEIADLNQGHYLRYLSPAVLTSPFADKPLKGNAIWEIQTF